MLRRVYFPCAQAALRGSRLAAHPWIGSTLPSLRSSSSASWAAGHAEPIRGWTMRVSDRRRRCKLLGGCGTAVWSILTPPHAAGGALEEGGHRFVGRSDLQLLVVRVVVAALATVGCDQTGPRQDEREACTAVGRGGGRGESTHRRSGRHSSTRPDHRARRRPPSARASPPRSPCSSAGRRKGRSGKRSACDPHSARAGWGGVMMACGRCPLGVPWNAP